MALNAPPLSIQELQDKWCSCLNGRGDYPDLAVTDDDEETEGGYVHSIQQLILKKEKEHHHKNATKDDTTADKTGKEEEEKEPKTPDSREWTMDDIIWFLKALDQRVRDLPPGNYTESFPDSLWNMVANDINSPHWGMTKELLPFSIEELKDKWSGYWDRYPNSAPPEITGSDLMRYLNLMDSISKRVCKKREEQDTKKKGKVHDWKPSEMLTLLDAVEEKVKALPPGNYTHSFPDSAWTAITNQFNAFNYTSMAGMRRKVEELKDKWSGYWNGHLNALPPQMSDKDCARCLVYLKSITKLMFKKRQEHNKATDTTAAAATTVTGSRCQRMTELSVEDWHDEEVLKFLRVLHDHLKDIITHMYCHPHSKDKQQFWQTVTERFNKAIVRWRCCDSNITHSPEFHPDQLKNKWEWCQMIWEKEGPDFYYYDLVRDIQDLMAKINSLEMEEEQEKQEEKEGEETGSTILDNGKTQYIFMNCTVNIYRRE